MYEMYTDRLISSRPQPWLYLAQYGNRLHQKEDEEVNRNGGGLGQVDDKCQKWEGQDPGDSFDWLWKYSFPSAYGKWTGKKFWEKTKRKLPSPPLGQSLYQRPHQRLPLLVYHISSPVRLGAFGAGLGSFFINWLCILVLCIRCYFAYCILTILASCLQTETIKAYARHAGPRRRRLYLHLIGLN